MVRIKSLINEERSKALVKAQLKIKERIKTGLTE